MAEIGQVTIKISLAKTSREQWETLTRNIRLLAGLAHHYHEKEADGLERSILKTICDLTVTEVVEEHKHEQGMESKQEVESV